jgi:hypothetical protein
MNLYFLKFSYTHILLHFLAITTIQNSKEQGLFLYNK